MTSDVPSHNTWYPLSSRGLLTGHSTQGRSPPEPRVHESLPSFHRSSMFLMHLSLLSPPLIGAPPFFPLLCINTISYCMFPPFVYSFLFVCRFLLLIIITSFILSSLLLSVVASPPFSSHLPVWLLPLLSSPLFSCSFSLISFPDCLSLISSPLLNTHHHFFSSPSHLIALILFFFIHLYLISVLDL